MCFPKPKTTTTPAPAPAPAAPEPIPEETMVGARRKKEEESTFGIGGPNFRVDRTIAQSGATAGGTGLKM